jgi:hypothetical protein
MTKKQKIQSLVLEVSKGLLKLGDSDAQKIIDICTAPSSKLCYARVSRYDGNNSRYEFVRKLDITQDQIDKAIKKALNEGPTKQFYWFELFNEDGLFEGSIYTIDQFIFHKL